MHEGPIETLSKTEYTAPLMALYSILAFQRLKETQGVEITDFEYGFGHSMGEITAAHIAGAMSFEACI